MTVAGEVPFAQHACPSENLGAIVKRVQELSLGLQLQITIAKPLRSAQACKAAPSIQVLFWSVASAHSANP